jgi:two-component system, OmpR family, phosphate regulon sensor histidine kinase PhoR
VLVIALKSFNKVLSNFKFSSIFLIEIFLFSIIFGILIVLLLDVTNSQLYFVALAILIFDLILLYSIGFKRRKDIEEIKSVIKSIRKNRFLHEDEIFLSKSLEDLEGNIKAMSRRTQEDIANMEKLAHARTEFLGYVSHELRTPIFTIQGYLETLLNGAVDDPNVNRTFLKKAFNHSENLNALLNDLIDISMIESGLLKLSFRYFKLYDHLDEIITDISQTLPSQKINLSLQKFNNGLEVYGDKDKLKQVMTNLISNAIKYTEEGSIDIIVIEKSKSVLVTVKDSGIGIAQEEIDRIFERFYRTDRERASSIPGTGLGLAIVKHIIEAHHSTIEVRSEINVGTEFTFKLKKFALS